MKPILGQVLLKPFPSDEKSEGGIFVPESFRKVSNKMKVAQVGNGVTKVKKGETVYRVKDWGQEIMVDGEKHFLMHETAILAKQ